jgi:hypothetical protein
MANGRTQAIHARQLHEILRQADLQVISVTKKQYVCLIADPIVLGACPVIMPFFEQTKALML